MDKLSNMPVEHLETKVWGIADSYYANTIGLMEEATLNVS
jgi:hypothetical protein